MAALAVHDGGGLTRTPSPPPAAQSSLARFLDRAKNTMARRSVSLVVAGAAVAAAATGAQQLLDPNGTSWQGFVRSPSSQTVVPARVLASHVAGNVTNPDGLLGGSSGPTVLSRSSASEDTPTLVVDLGQNMAGLLTITFSSSQNATAASGFPGLSLSFSETLQYLSGTSDYSRSDNARGAEKITNGTDQIAVKNHAYTWVNQFGCEYGTQVCADGLHGFRYVNISLHALDQDAPYTSSLGTVSIESVTLQFAGFLGTPDTFTGHFACSDPDITQWWYDGVYTNDLCTDTFHANDTEPRNANSSSLIGKLVLFDGAKRDRDPYVGDLAVAALTTYLSHDVPEAARNVLEDVVLHQTDDGWIPPASINDYQLPLFDYPLWWVVCSVDHVLYTGNTTYLQTYYPNLVKVLDTYYPAHTNNSTSLIERPSGMGDYAFLPRSGSVTYYNALYVRALNAAADMADYLGNQEDASRWRARASTVAPSLLKVNFDTSVGAFFDGGLCDGALCQTHSQDGNSLSILAGVVPTGSGDTSTAESILSYLDSATRHDYGNSFFDNDLLGAGYSTRVYAFISYFEIAARFAASPSTAASALDELRRLYGWMASHGPGITMWEGIGKDGSLYEQGFTSMAHGWSTGIVPLMINYILGVTPTAPGFSEWIINPVLNGTDLTWASGVVPTPNGGISVEWRKADNGQYSLITETPTNTKGVITVPLVAPDSGSVTVNGRVVYDGADNPNGSVGYVSVSLSGGQHQITVT